MHSFHDITSIEIARLFIKQGNFAKAADLLNEIIAKSESSVSTQAVSLLADIPYMAKQWQEAAYVLQVLTQLCPEDPEAALKFGHCLVEMELLKEAQDLKNNVARSLENRTSHNLDQALRTLYFCLCDHFSAGRHEEARNLVEYSCFSNTYSATISGKACSPSAVPTEGTIRSKIENALHQASNCRPLGTNILAPFVNRTLEGSLKGKKLLLIIRGAFAGHLGSNSREHELPVFFERSARSCGIEVQRFPADVFHNNACNSFEFQLEAVDALTRVVVTFQPDLVVFDDLCTQASNEAGLDREFYKSLLEHLRSQVHFKIAAVYFDAWLPQCTEAIQYVRSFVDVVWHQNSELIDLSAKSGDTKAVMLYAPFPYPDDLFHSEEENRNLPCAFIGGLNAANWPRGVWLSLIQSKKLPCEIFLSNHTKTGCAAGSTVSEYVRFLSRISIMVNFTARNTTKRIMTGRTWEGILSGCLLLEEDNPETKNFFIPFLHYVPFQNILELEAYLKFFLKHEDLRREISKNALNWFQAQYHGSRIWRAVFGAGGTVPKQ